MTGPSDASEDEPEAVDAGASGAPSKSPPDEGHLDGNVEEMHDRLASNPAAFKLD